MTLAESFGQSGFAQFINSPAGRLMRLVVGIGLVGYGFTHRTSPSGLVLVVVGLIPLLAGAFDLCLISGLLGGPFRGARLRAQRKP
jgi:Inner membrane protein YgaP-like, transmembrane domain